VFCFAFGSGDFAAFADLDVRVEPSDVADFAQNSASERVCIYLRFGGFFSEFNFYGERV
jgi:hypothetical protein